MNKLKELAAEFDFLKTSDLKEFVEQHRLLINIHRMSASDETEMACIASLDFMAAMSELSTVLEVEEGRVLELLVETDFQSNIFFKVHPRAVARLRDQARGVA